MLTKQHESQPATDRALAQAKYVFSTGRLIHDRVFQIQARQIACMGKKKKFGDLSMAQVNTLMTIRKRGPMSLSELATDLCVSPPSASAMVDRLVEKGLVTREQSPEDRRRVVIRVSPEAMKEIVTIEEVIFQAFVDIVERVGPEVAEQWCAVLDKVSKALAETAPDVQEVR